MLSYGVDIQKFKTAETPEGAGAAAKELGLLYYPLKGVVHDYMYICRCV